MSLTNQLINLSLLINFTLLYLPLTNVAINEPQKLYRPYYIINYGINACIVTIICFIQQTKLYYEQ